MRDKKVIDWVDKIVEREHRKSRVKEYGRVPALKRVQKRLFNYFMRLPKNTDIREGTKARFMIESMEHVDDLVDSFEYEWARDHCCRAQVEKE